jgi:hypothetical protein
VGAEQRFEAPSLLGGGEPVQHDGVLSHMGVHVQLDERSLLAHGREERR